MRVRKAGKLDCWIVGNFGFSGFLNKQKIYFLSQNFKILRFSPRPYFQNFHEIKNEKIQQPMFSVI